MKEFWPKNVSYFQILQGKHQENFKDEVFWILHGLYKGPCRVREGFQNTSRLINFHQHMDHAAYALQAAWVRFQQQLPCSWFCVNELQSAAKIMLRGPKKLKWGLLSTWLTFPVSFRHILRDFNGVWSAFRDSLFPLSIKLSCCIILAESTVHLAVLWE